MLHEYLKITSKWMYIPPTTRKLIDMVTSRVLRIGIEGDAEVTTFSIDEHYGAIENASRKGGWRNYTVITTNAE